MNYATSDNLELLEKFAAAFRPKTELETRRYAETVCQVFEAYVAPNGPNRKNGLLLIAEAFKTGLAPGIVTNGNGYIRIAVEVDSPNLLMKQV